MNRQLGWSGWATLVAVAVLGASQPIAGQSPPDSIIGLFSYDRTAPLDIEVVEERVQDGVEVIDLTYASPMGGRVPAFMYRPMAAGRGPGIVVMHGMPGARDNVGGLAHRYARAGAVVIAITAPFARASGPSVTFTGQDRRNQIQLIMDLQRAVDLLSADDRVDPTKMAYVGGSYGGAMGGLLAAVESRVGSYVLMLGDGGLVAHFTGPEDRGGALDRLSAEDRVAWLRLMGPIEPIALVPFAAPSALLFQNGRLDQGVPPADAAAYISAASHPKEEIWYEAGHEIPPEMLSDQFRWLSERLGVDLRGGS